MIIVDVTSLHLTVLFLLTVECFDEYLKCQIIWTYIIEANSKRFNPGLPGMLKENCASCTRRRRKIRWMCSIHIYTDAEWNIKQTVWWLNMKELFGLWKPSLTTAFLYSCWIEAYFYRKYTHINVAENRFLEFCVLSSVQVKTERNLG